MGLFAKPQKTDFPGIPDNLYVARLSKIANKIGQKSQKPYLSWGFEIVQPPFVKRWVWGNTQPTVSPKSQAGKYLTVLGVDLSSVDESFNEQSLVGKYVKVLLETTENDDGEKFQNVTKLMALTEADIQQLQGWLTQANVTGPVKVAAQVSQPVVQQPVLATAPVSFPVQPVAPVAPVVVVAPAPAAVPAPVAPVTAAPAKKFPF